MKKNWVRISLIAFATAILVPATSWAQKEEKEEKKTDKEKTEVQQIIVTRKSDKDEKIVIEVKGDKVTVNGKPIEEFKDKNGDINVKVNRMKDWESLVFNRTPGSGWTVDDKTYQLFGEDENKAMLGVTTTKADEGVQIQSITKESAAEKAGLKENDIITKVDDKKIEEPDDLSAAIQKHKPGEKVTITYLRDKKEAKVTAELTKWKGVTSWGLGGDNKFKMDMGAMHFDKVMPRVTTPGGKYPYSYTTGGTPKLGLSVQDTDDGKGVKVIGVDTEGNAAKSGIQKDDVITEVDGKAINNADDIVKVMKESKEKVSVMFKLQRSGKTQNVEVKIPRKLKTTTL
jgi:serine protease Do